MTDVNALLGTIVDTNSRGRFDLLVYADGILAIKGTYIGVVLRTAGPGMGVGADLGGGAYEQRRIAKQLDQSRDALLTTDEGNHFVPASSVTRLELRKRWYGHSLLIVSHDVREGRKYEWKPALNTFAAVNQLLESVFGPRLVRT